MTLKAEMAFRKDGLGNLEAAEAAAAERAYEAAALILPAIKAELERPDFADTGYVFYQSFGQSLGGMLVKAFGPNVGEDVLMCADAMLRTLQLVHHVAEKREAAGQPMSREEQTAIQVAEFRRIRELQDLAKDAGRAMVPPAPNASPEDKKRVLAGAIRDAINRSDAKKH